MISVIQGGVVRADVTSALGTSAAALLATFGAGVLSGRVANPGGNVSGLTVSIFVDGAGSAAGTATTASDGSWSYTPSGLSAGAHTFQARVLQGSIAVLQSTAVSGNVSASGGNGFASFFFPPLAA